MQGFLKGHMGLYRDVVRLIGVIMENQMQHMNEGRKGSCHHK